MVVCVFLQFFTRYALNNSLAWTEEIAINALVVVVFLGRSCACGSRGTSMSTYFTTICPPAAGDTLSLAVDVIRVGFFAYASWLMWRYVSIVADERMTTVNLPRTGSSIWSSPASC